MAIFYMCKIAVIIYILFCFSCTEHVETISVSSFGKTGHLIAEIKEMPEPVLLPRYMGIVGDKLFVYKEKEQFLFEFFSLPEGDYIGCAGTRGQGPDEWIGMLDTRSFCVEDTTFSVIEASTNLFKTVVYADHKLHVTHTDFMREQGRPYQGLYLLKDSMYFTLGNIIEPDEYCLFDWRDNQKIKSTEFPQWVSLDEADSPAASAFTYIKTCVVSPDRCRFAAFYGYFKRLRICDDKLNLLHDIKIDIEPFHTNFSQNGDISQQPVYYIGQPQAIGDKIYALCSNAMGSGDHIPSRSELHVFDWEGHPLACYLFDRYVSLFAISEQYRKIYALDKNKENELYVYDLPSL